jgi:hypothetical protein
MYILKKLQKYYSFFNSCYYLFFLVISFTFFIRKTIALNSYISNYVGNYYTLDGGTNVNIASPAFLWADTSSNIIFVDQESCVIREYNATSSRITTLVGTFLCGNNGQGLTGTLTQLSNPSGMRGDTFGNLYFSESTFGTVRKWTRSTGLVSKIAGTTANGPAVDDIPAVTSQLNNPQGIWISTSGFVYIADSQNHRIRIVAGNGIISTIAGNGSPGTSSDGQLATNSQIDTPSDIIGDSSGNLFFTQCGGSTYNLRKIDFAHIIFTLITSGGSLQLPNPYQLAFSSSYGLYISIKSENAIYNYDSNSVIEIIAGNNPTSGPSVENALAVDTFLYNPTGLCLDTIGNLYIGQAGNQVISKVTHSNGRITRLLGGIKLAGDNGPATTAVLNKPTGLWGNSNTGKLYIADSGNNRIRVIDSTINTHPVISWTDNSFTLFDLNAPFGIWPDPTDSFLYVTDTGRVVVYKISLTGSNSQVVIAGIASTANSGCPTFSNPTGNSLYFPTGIWVSLSGIIYFADTKCHIIRQLNGAGGILSVLAGTIGGGGFTGDGEAATSAHLNNPYGIWGDSYNNFFISDTMNGRIRFIDHSNGIITTIAGGTVYTAFASLLMKATNAILNQPTSIMGDSSGNLFITERDNYMIRKMYLSGNEYNISVFSGYGGSSSAGKSSTGAANSIYIGSPNALWIDSASIIYFTDSMNVVRQVIQFNDPTGQPSRQPTGQPSRQPVSFPTAQPSSQPQVNPTSLPSSVPSRVPSVQPSSQPVSRPTSQPTAIPSGFPSCVPTIIPSTFPSGQPTSDPSSQPSLKPSVYPSGQPSSAPSDHPTCVPSIQPTSSPSMQPSSIPSLQPSAVPTTRPSSTPSINPSSNPTAHPSIIPSVSPSSIPSFVPSRRPSSQPSALPSSFPTSDPSGQPSKKPSCFPSSLPSVAPSSNPSTIPSSLPTIPPSSFPSTSPSTVPTDGPSSQPSSQPFSDPSSKPSTQPSLVPSSIPTHFPTGVPSSQPSNSPSQQPSTVPSSVPSEVPSSDPSPFPSSSPSCRPTLFPSNQPSSSPSDIPSSNPSCNPSSQPTLCPSDYPSGQPTAFPSSCPTLVPSSQPTSFPSSCPTLIPSSQPTAFPSSCPTLTPSSQPTSFPSSCPTLIPSSQPTSLPSKRPSSVPSGNPTSFPTTQPSSVPSSTPSFFPSTQPSSIPSTFPTAVPSASPSSEPSTSPSACPAGLPSSVPTDVPTSVPTTLPSIQPSSCPTSDPSNIPSSWPSSCPSTSPSSFPTSTPSSTPSFLPSARPSGIPSSLPSLVPTSTPSCSPTATPTSVPSSFPSSLPSSSPSNLPSSVPSSLPSAYPSGVPRSSPSSLPSSIPSLYPSTLPTSTPTCCPSNLPSSIPSLAPSSQPSIFPTAIPTSQPSLSPTSNPTASILLYPGPLLTNVTFASDGSYLIVEFDSPTNLGGFSLLSSFSCNHLFDFPCSSLSKCQWINSKIVYAYIKTSDECAKPTDIIKLAKNAVIKAPCSLDMDDCSKYDQWSISNTSAPLASMRIANAANPISPSIIVSLPSKLSWNCSSLTLDLTGSYGNCGRSWRNISILVGSNIHDLDLSKLQEFLDHRYQMNPPSSIPAHYFSLPNVRYTFEVKLCNFLGTCSYATESVLMISEAVPTVKIISSQPSPVKITRSRSLQLLSIATIDSACNASSVSKNSISYNWTTFSVVTPTEKQFQSGIISTSKDPSRFVLPSYSLLSNHTYEVILTVSSELGYFQSTSTSVQVFVNEGSLLVKIKGGINERNIRSGESLSLDAANSYDEDKGESIHESEAGLHFEWSCIQLEPIINRTSCAAVFEIQKSALSSSIITMKASINSEHSKVQWTLKIYDELKSRSVSSSVLVAILPLLSPTISLQSNALLGKGGGTMNAGQSLQITGTINIPAGIKSNASWTVLGSAPLSLSSVSLTPLSQQFPASTTSSQSFTIFLALPGNTLFVGSSYAFGLRCQLSYPGKSALSTIMINVNSPPTPGSFTIQPMSGREIIDSFTFLCNQWIDANLPLSYQFSYLSLSGMKIVIRSSSIISYASSKLPGGRSRNGTVLCIADIYDSLSANSTASLPVYVLKAEDVNAIDASSFIHSTLTVAATVDELMKGTAIASYLLNSANCSLSPNCTALNRLPCYSSSHTCGPCLSSLMIGLKGDSNDKCYDPLSSSSISVDHQLKKVCAGNCSSHGHCVAYSALTNSPLTSSSSLSPIPCYEGDLSCYVKCECYGGYQKSPNCEVSDHQIEERSKLREIVVNRVIDYINLQDASETTIYAWMNSLNEVSKVSHELSNSSISSIMKVTLEAITTVRDRGIDVHIALSNLLTTADTISEALVFQNNLLTTTATASSSSAAVIDDSSSLAVEQQSSLFNMLSNYSLVIASSMVPDQQPNRNANGNFRIHSSLLSSSSMEVVGTNGKCGRNVSIDMPSTALETALGYRPSTLSVPFCSINSSSFPISFSLISLASSLYHHSDFKSDPVSLYLSSQPCVNPEDENCRIEIVMKSENSETALVKEGKNITVVCVEGEFRNHTIRCASSVSSGWKNYTVSCHGKAETITATCPAVYTSPTCNGLVGETASDIGCMVVAYTESNITCSCPLSAVSTRRRLLSLNQTTSSDTASTVSTSYVVMLQEIEENFISTLFSASSLNKETAKDSWQAIVTLGSLVIVILLAMIASIHADKKMETKVGTERNIMMHAISAQPQRRQQGRLVTFFQQKQQLNGASSHSTSSSQHSSAFSSPATVLQLAEEALPSILSSQSLWKRMWHEIKRHHRWIGVIYYFSDKFPRILRVVSLATNIIVMLFIQSLTYNLTQGDDGSCEALHSEDNCVSPRSAYGTGGNKCYWSWNDGQRGGTGVGAVTTAGGYCSFVQPDNSIAIVFLVAIFSALTASPVALFADWIVQNILAAPTKNEKTRGVKILASIEGREHHLDDKREDIQLMGQFISFEKDILQQEKLKQRVKEEFYSMKKELLRYRETIIKADEKAEFDGKRACCFLSLVVS